jgi:hypothetical protein
MMVQLNKGVDMDARPVHFNRLFQTRFMLNH